MRQLYKDRLTKLAVFLRDNVKPENFDMSSICSTNGDTQDMAYDSKTKTWRAVSCGTVCCAVGYSPCVFTNLGLKYHFDSNGIYDHSGNYWDGEEFYGLTTDQWEWLFGTDDPESENSRDYEKPKQVARRILNFVENDGKMPRRIERHFNAEQNDAYN